MVRRHAEASSVLMDTSLDALEKAQTVPVRVQCLLQWQLSRVSNQVPGFARWGRRKSQQIGSQRGLGTKDLSPLAMHEPRIRRQFSPVVVFRARPVVTEPRYILSLVARVPVTLLD